MTDDERQAMTAAEIIAQLRGMHGYFASHPAVAGYSQYIEDAAAHIAAAAEDCERLRAQNDRLAYDRQSQDIEAANLRESLAQAQRDLATVRAELDSSRRLGDSFQVQIDNLREVRSKLQAELATLRAECERLTSEAPRDTTSLVLTQTATALAQSDEALAALTRGGGAGSPEAWHDRAIVLQAQLDAVCRERDGLMADCEGWERAAKSAGSGCIQLQEALEAMRQERETAPKAWAEFLDDGSLHRCAVDGFRCMDDAVRVQVLRVPEPRPDEVGR